MKGLRVGGLIVAAALGTGAVVVTYTPIGARLMHGGPGLAADKIAPPPPPSIAPAPGLKLAFLGDTGSGPDFQRVLELVRREGSDAVVHLGDAIYDQETPAQFWAEVDRVLGHGYPYFLAQGNHDAAQWPAMAEHAYAHLKASGAVTDATGQLDPRLGLVYRGVSLVMLGHDPGDEDPKFILDRFSRDEHIWKVCAWHKNQEELQVGGKGDEMGWGVYEACRLMGGMIQTGHEHSYHRTKTLADTVEQTVDPACGDPRRLCVRPGAVPVFVNGLGGRSIRDQERCLPDRPPYGCQGEWAFIYTSNQGAHYGALFMAFNKEGIDPKRAHGYFKTAEGVLVDEFEVTAH